MVMELIVKKKKITSLYSFFSSSFINMNLEGAVFYLGPGRYSNFLSSFLIQNFVEFAGDNKDDTILVKVPNTEQFLVIGYLSLRGISLVIETSTSYKIVSVEENGTFELISCLVCPLGFAYGGISYDVIFNIATRSGYFYYSTIANFTVSDSSKTMFAGSFKELYFEDCLISNITAPENVLVKSSASLIHTSNFIVRFLVYFFYTLKFLVKVSLYE
jgi:hypothetical protein